MIERFTTNEVTEVCSNCMSQNILQWNVADDGYKAYCPHCGDRLMLCDVCPIRSECRYDSKTDSCPMEHECCLDRDNFMDYLEDNFDMTEDLSRLISNTIDVMSKEFIHLKDKRETFKRIVQGVLPLTEREINMIKF